MPPAPPAKDRADANPRLDRLMDARKTILIVDDNPTNVVILERALQQAGYDTLAAGSSEELFTHLQEQLPDLILLDLMLPGTDGIEICRMLRERPDTSVIPVIFVTAVADTDRISEAFQAGGCDYITKPFRIDEIVARVGVHLRILEEKRRLLEEKRKMETRAERLRTINQKLSEQARTDPLTGVLSRRAWEEAAQAEHENATLRGEAYAILMLDVDHFKAYNDAYGHPAGDRCLQHAVEAIVQSLRDVDIVGRYGGEEFVILIPATSMSTALHIAERIRMSVWNLNIRHTKSPLGRVTVSIGVAPSDSRPLPDVVQEADDALYRAKRCGRNIVEG
ncbi:MAG: diguanylate cyclase, partial [Planctomycetota bacterium]